MINGAEKVFCQSEIFILPLIAKPTRSKVMNLFINRLYAFCAVAARGWFPVLFVFRWN